MSQHVIDLMHINNTINFDNYVKTIVSRSFFIDTFQFKYRISQSDERDIYMVIIFSVIYLIWCKGEVKSISNLKTVKHTGFLIQKKKLLWHGSRMGTPSGKFVTDYDY